MKSLRFLLLALLLFAIVALIFIQYFGTGAGDNPVLLFSAAQDIPAGARIDDPETMFGRSFQTGGGHNPDAVHGSGWFRGIEELRGKVLKRALKKGDRLYQEDLEASKP